MQRNNTPLHIACSAGDVGFVMLLLMKGSPVNALNIDGFTALHIACKQCSEDCVKSLISGGADIHATGTVKPDIFRGWPPFPM